MTNHNVYNVRVSLFLWTCWCTYVGATCPWSPGQCFVVKWYICTPFSPLRLYLYAYNSPTTNTLSTPPPPPPLSPPPSSLPIILLASSCLPFTWTFAYGVSLRYQFVRSTSTYMAYSNEQRIVRCISRLTNWILKIKKRRAKAYVTDYHDRNGRVVPSWDSLLPRFLVPFFLYWRRVSHQILLFTFQFSLMLIIIMLLSRSLTLFVLFFSLTLIKNNNNNSDYW